MKRVLITRPRSKAEAFANALSEAGFDPIYFPVIEIRPMEDNTALDRALRKLACYDWITFTSVNGVEIFWDRLKTLGKLEFPKGVQIAAIGPKTAEALESRGLEPEFVPAEYIAEAILPGLGDLRGRWVLLPRAEVARKTLPQAISKAGGIAHEISIYQTIPAEPDELGLKALHDGVDAITFTSPSTVHNFFSLARKAGLNPLNLPGRPLVACIGPITASAAVEEGLEVDLVAEEYTALGLTNMLKNKVYDR